MKKCISFIAAVCMSTIPLCEVDAQTVLFKSDSLANCYRIPALLTASKNKLFAISDYRYCRSDVGGGKIDIVGRISHDNGETWKDDVFTLVKGSDDNSNPFNVAHGDAAVVTDRTTGKMLMMCASGNVYYWNSTLKNPNRVGRYYSGDGVHWEGEEITDQIYKIMNGAVTKLFFTSGRICQSSKIKVGKYFRIYSALCTNIGNVVLYSDDFGKTWLPLGGVEARPTLDGDEAKIIELPNGNVLLSSRSQKGNGRIFNVYRYSNSKKAIGEWGDAKYLDEKYKAARCNGEILLVPARRTADGKKTHVLLFSVPQSDVRHNVGIYYKELATANDYATPSCFVSEWNTFPVSNLASGYSTMELLPDGKVAFFYEETECKGGYDMVFHKLGLDTITNGKFVYMK